MAALNLHAMAAKSDTSVDPRTDVIEVRRLSKHYDDVAALSDVSFLIRENEILGIIGPNGSGKTTLMECLAGFIAPDSGQVRLRGQQLPLSRRREILFYLPDGIAPFGDLTVGRVLSIQARLHGRPASVLGSVVEALTLAPVWHKPVTALSKGYRRRLLLALALVAPQRVLLLDEPFDGFDLRQTLAVVKLLREVVLADAERICDRFLLLGAGRVLACGSLDSLCEQAGAARRSLEEVFLALT